MSTEKMRTSSAPRPKLNGSSPKSSQVLEILAAKIADFPPELRKAARFVLENPNEISVSSIRQIASAAGVKPNNFVRMARAIGFSGYDDFREPFREQIRWGRPDFPDRARWLQSLSKGGKLGGLYSDMASLNIGNIEEMFEKTNAKQMKAAADSIIAARNTYVLGVGISHALARNFAYLAGMAINNVTAIPRDGSHPIDDLAHAGKKDVLVAMTFKPYRREVVEAVQVALDQGLTVIALSDSPASPILRSAKFSFVVPTETPQFFTSTVAVIACLETLIAFMIADADVEVIESIEKFHRRRHELGIYWSSDS